MLAVVSHHVAQAPADLRCKEDGGVGAEGEGVVKAFLELNGDSVSMRCEEKSKGSLAVLCYSHHAESFTCPRTFAAADDMFCLFAGSLENLPQLRQIYGLSRSVCEGPLLLEAYRALRDRGAYTADQVLADLKGNFSFILYDNKAKHLFVARDHTGRFPFYWGTCNDGSLAISDSSQIIKAGCQKSFAPFPEGCFFSSKDGLKCYEHPNRSLRAIPHVDSQGQMCGSKFEVEHHKKNESDAGKDWLNSF